MKFIVDAQLPPALARFLTESGHPAEHVADVKLKDADDSKIWNYAIKNNCAILTKDEDFAERILLDSKGPSIVWLRVGNCSNQAMLTWFKPLLPQIVKHLGEDDKLIEVV